MAHQGFSSRKGSIELILGPMFSGKSTMLVQRIRRYIAASNRCFVLNYKGDTRYGADPTMVQTHDRTKMKARAVQNLREVENEVWQYDVIAIDEGQFMPDLVKYSEEWANQGKTIIIAALDGTFQRQPFNAILQLIPLAESVVKLSAVCATCHADAAFTKRTTSETGVEVIGGAESYQAACRQCFLASPSPTDLPQQKTQAQAARRKSGRIAATRRQSLEALSDATNTTETHNPHRRTSLQALSLR